MINDIFTAVAAGVVLFCVIVSAFLLVKYLVK